MLIYLELSFKSLNSDIILANLNQTNITKENRKLKYQLGIVTEVLEFNISKQPFVNSSTYPSLFNNSHEVKLLLYLKANSCSDCNISVVSELIERLSKDNNIIIVSHRTNQAFVNALLDIPVILTPIPAN